MASSIQLRLVRLAESRRACPYLHGVPLHLHFSASLIGSLFVFALAARSSSGPDPLKDEIPALLRQIAVESDTGLNPYLGQGRLGELRVILDQLSSKSTWETRWATSLQIGDNELRLGLVDQAIESYGEALRLVLEAEGPKKEVNRTRFKLGVAHLRRGELDNCCKRFSPESCLLPIRGAGLHSDSRGSRAAMGHFVAVARGARKASWIGLRSRWLLNLAAMTLGEYPSKVPEDLRIDPSRFESQEEFPAFEQVAGERGLATVDLAGGLGVEDYNGDGWLDVITSTSDTSGPMRLLLNDGEGGFRDSSESLSQQLGGLNLIHGDYDNDGDVDLFVLRGAWWQGHGRHPNSLLRNEGDGRFVDVTVEAGLAEPFLPTQTAAWADYDNDGDLDLYVGNESSDLSVASQLFRNEGDGHFVDVAEKAGVTNLRYAKGVVWGDFDNDRWPDLYVSNMGSHNRLYHNQGDGTFIDIASRAGVQLPISGFPCWFFDHNNDGRLDLFAGAYGGARTPPDVGDVAARYFDRKARGENHRLYTNLATGFQDQAEALGLVAYSLPMGANFGDLDNDGWLDFYLGTGYPGIEALMPNQMYRNREGRGFVDITSAGRFGHLQKGHAIAFADFDRDGDEDVFEQMGGAFPGDAFANALYLNPGMQRNWVQIRAEGVESNRNAIGVRVVAHLREGESSRQVHRVVGSGGSFGANPFLVQIGLGEAEELELLELYWPTSDRRQRFEGVRANRRYRVVEGTTELTVE